jgi:hypothetical protein
MTSVVAVVAAAGTVAATVVYLIRTLRRLAAAVDKWGEIFAGWDDLKAETQANTEAIKMLTGQVARLARLEQAKATQQ